MKNFLMIFMLLLTVATVSYAFYQRSQAESTRKTLMETTNLLDEKESRLTVQEKELQEKQAKVEQLKILMANMDNQFSGTAIHEKELSAITAKVKKLQHQVTSLQKQLEECRDE